MKKDKLGEILLVNPIPFISGIIIISAFLYSKIFHILPLKINILFFIPIVFLISEFILRFILLTIYGKKYRYRFSPYFIIDDKECGFKLRKNIRSSEIDFPIFERYAFPINTNISPNKSQNILQRVFFTTDHNGLRNTHTNSISKSKSLKIICSGGSTTAGQGIDDKDCWPSKLEYALNNQGISSEVFNAGIYGYDSYQELQNLKYNLLTIKPDILILHQGWNEEFEFSALGMGRRFKPKQARRYFEKWYFFSNNIRFFPRKFLLAILTLRHIRRNISLKKNMSFENPKRWNVLLNDAYIKNWFDNLNSIKKICIENKIRLFLVNYPCLVQVNDNPKNRQIYINNTRLTANFSSYQAFAKARIDEFYKLISNDFKILDGNSEFQEINGLDRLDLFSDEIHLSAKGEDLLARSICKDLVRYIKNYSYKDYKSRSLKINSYKNINSEKLRAVAGKNSQQLSINIRRYITRNLQKNKLDQIEISSDIYTTT